VRRPAAQVEGSGTTAMPIGPFNPETSAELIVAPVVALYSPIVLPLMFATKRSPWNTAMPSGVFNPETSEALTVAPELSNTTPKGQFARTCTGDGQLAQRNYQQLQTKRH
jgi:hypothetical protein